MGTHNMGYLKNMTTKAECSGNPFTQSWHISTNLASIKKLKYNYKCAHTTDSPSQIFTEN